MKKIILALITLLLLSTPVLAADFPDVPRDGSEMSNAIYKLADAGIVGGYEDGCFRPDRHLTRAELCKIVNLIFGYSTPDTENFKDVNSNDWFYGYVLVAKKAGYIKGFEDQTFRGNTSLTRQQTCIIISRTAGLYDLPTSAVIKDKVDDWAKADVMKVIANFVMPLPADGMFRATENITRAELAMALDAFVTTSVTPPVTPPSDTTVPIGPVTPPVTTTYTVKFYNAEGKVISTQTVNQGASATAPTAPQKSADKENTYSFKGWDKSFSSVWSNLDIHPTYNETKIRYTVKLNYGNGTTGTMPESIVVYYNTKVYDMLPSNDSFQNGNLLFAGWYDGDNLIDTELYCDLKSDTLTAKWTSVFTVKFYDAEGKVKKTQYVNNGENASAPSSPKKTADKEYTYTFKSWDKNFTNVQSDLDVYPLYNETPIIYTVNLSYGSGTTGTLTSSVNVTYRQLLSSDVLPTTGFKREGYLFEGWYYNNEPVEGKTFADIEPRTLTAKWTKVYTVNFYDFDGNIIKTEKVKSGASATPPANPTKTEDNEYTYSFGGWNKSFTNVQSNLDVSAVLNKTAKLYTITLDYTTGKTETKTVTYYQEIKPLLPASVPHDTKLFAGWYAGQELIDGERYCDLPSTTLTAKWTDLFTVRFYNATGTVIKTEYLKKGASATAPTAPQKAEDNEYTYSFKSWDKSFTNIQSDLDVHPVYNNTDKLYSVVIDYGTGKKETVKYKYREELKNKLPSNVENGEKTLLGWYVGDTKIDTQTYAQLSPSKIEAKWASALTVKFYNASGAVIKTQSVKLGNSATAPQMPSKSPSDEYTYTFKGWSADFTNVQTNLDVYPLYNEHIRYYEITLDYGEETTGTMPETASVTYNELLTDAIPSTGFSNHPFIFDGWYSGSTSIEGKTYKDLKPKTLVAKWKANPTVIENNKPVINEMQNVLDNIAEPESYGFTPTQLKVLQPVQEAIKKAIEDAKAGYEVDKQFVLDRYSSLVTKAGNLYYGRIEGGFTTDKAREDFRSAIGNNLTLDTIKYLADFFDIDIGEYI